MGQFHLGQLRLEPKRLDPFRTGEEFIRRRLVRWDPVQDGLDAKSFLEPRPVDQPAAAHDLEGMEIMVARSSQAWVPGDGNRSFPAILGFHMDLRPFDPESDRLHFFVILSGDWHAKAP
jgi:hypothetical protein